MGVAIRESGIDVVVHGAGGEFDLEVGLVLDGIAALRRIGEVILGDVVAVEVVIERIVDDGKIIGGLVCLYELRVDVQGVRTRTRGFVDDDPVAELDRTPQVYGRPEGRDRYGRAAGEVRAVVDQSLIHSIDAVAFTVSGVDKLAVELDRVFRR